MHSWDFYFTLRNVVHCLLKLMKTRLLMAYSLR